MNYDAAIIGAGPGGYVAAIRMAQLGMKIALIEERDLGGVCTNRGCIPTKALYSATKLLERARDAEEMGIKFPAPAIDLERLASWKEKVVSTMVEGIDFLLEANGITVYRARGMLASAEEINLSTGERVAAERIVIATGSLPIELSGFNFSEPCVWSSDDALALTEIPNRLVVIGGGVIGLELATIYNRLGSRVTVLEMMPELLPGLDLDRRTIITLKRSLKAQGIDIRVNTPAQSIEETTEGAMVQLAGGDAVAADRILLAVGRRPNTTDIGLETVGIELDKQGFITVDGDLQTNVPGVYAIGDLVPGPMLAHKASREGIKLAAVFVGDELPLDYGNIPQVVFTDPEIASTGLSEKKAKERGYEISVGRFPYAALGKAQGMRETEGFLQVVANARDGRLLGAQIIGAEASTLIAEFSIVVQNGFSLSAIVKSVHAHPTLPEGVKEAAENALGQAIHKVNRS
ncbi:MAG: dihydrolipoyl dehydrogenase [Candidatus Bipolaricaulota bacterium]|nr:dihydrolipoyl dehydrogenase [Candidatus Bipolaricaulota bacterium]